MLQMKKAFVRSFLRVVLMVISFDLFIVAALTAANVSDPSGCAACHTNETALLQNLSPEKPKSSALTAGAG